MNSNDEQSEQPARKLSPAGRDCLLEQLVGIQARAKAIQEWEPPEDVDIPLSSIGGTRGVATPIIETCQQVERVFRANPSGTWNATIDHIARMLIWLLPAELNLQVAEADARWINEDEEGTCSES